jgi:hypothetical protein
MENPQTSFGIRFRIADVRSELDHKPTGGLVIRLRVGERAESAESGCSNIAYAVGELINYGLEALEDAVSNASPPRRETESSKRMWTI